MSLGVVPELRVEVEKRLFLLGACNRRIKLQVPRNRGSRLRRVTAYGTVTSQGQTLFYRRLQTVLYFCKPIESDLYVPRPTSSDLHQDSLSRNVNVTNHCNY